MASLEVVFRVLFTIIGIRQVTGACDNVTWFSIQVDTLMAEYDRTNPPATPVNVLAWLEVRYASIHEPTASVRLLANLHLKWSDTRLAWNSTAWGCDKALVSSERLWLPDVVLLSAATSNSDPSDTGLRARLTNDGKVNWVTRLDLSAPLTMDMYSWPDDQHTIAFNFGSRSHSVDELDIAINSTQDMLMVGSAAWQTPSLTSSTQLWESVGVQKSVVSWEVTMKRGGRAHKLAVGAVMVATALLLVAAAMLPPDSRPALCAAAAFISALWLISSAPKLAGSARVPLMLSLVCTLCVCACAYAIAAALVRRVSRCSAPPPQPLRVLLTATSLHCRLTPTESGEGQSNAWVAAAQLLDRTLLALLLLTIFIVLCIYLFSN